MEEAGSSKEEPTFTVEEFEHTLKEANRVLGVDDPDKCTYEMGYRTRQAVFACLTCTKDQPAGVCTACALRCHDSHEVVELWTRRSFRCDCGNSKFGSAACQLCPNKEPENAGNTYNHNYKGLYCFCKRPYPDPERAEDDEEEEDMTQCVACEDWFHDGHLGQSPEGLEYEEIICPACFNSKCKFLALYPATVAPTPAPEDAPDAEGAVGTESQAGTGGSAMKAVSGTESQAGTGGATQGSKECKLRERLEGRSLADVVRALTSADLFAVAGRDTLKAPLEVPVTPSGGEKPVGRGSETSPSAPSAPGSQEETPLSAPASEITAAHGAGAQELTGEVRETKGEAAEVRAEGGERTADAKGPSAAAGAPGAGAEMKASRAGAEGLSACAQTSEAGKGAEAEAGPPEALAGTPPKGEGKGSAARGLYVHEAPPLFLKQGWRADLCSCADCTSYYEAQGVAFLADEGDTIRAYEAAVDNKTAAMQERAEQQLKASIQQLGHVGQMELAYHTTDLQRSMASYLDALRESKGTDHVVTADDVHTFFEDFKKKRQRRS